MRANRWAGLGTAGLAVLTAGCTAAGPGTGTPSAAPAAPPCRSVVTRDALPAWARAGFSDDGAGVPHVFSERGDLIAVLFRYPPAASDDPAEGTKILWVSRLPGEPGRPLRIEATRAGTATTLIREVPGGPGPSSVQLPAAGCWQLVLSWSGHRDRMALDFG